MTTTVNKHGKKQRPLIALTLGDVAGIGPEVAVAAALAPEVRAVCRPLLVGDPEIVARALALLGCTAPVDVFQAVGEARGEGTGNSEPGTTASPITHHSSPTIQVWNPTTVDVTQVIPGQIDPRAGKAAFDWLVASAQAALKGEIDAIVTAPLHKKALHEAGVQHPGHTEILAECCAVKDFAMMLYLPTVERSRSPHGLAIAHVTLHTSIASVPGLLTASRVREKIGLIDHFLKRIGVAQPRIGVCALNPHAGEVGLFGDEESRIIAPAVSDAEQAGVHVTGPLPADTLILRAVGGEFDGVVAMYHDQGHIPIKLIGFGRAVNVTLGLPIVRTSPSHGTAFDIAWQGKADPRGMISAVMTASILANGGRHFSESLQPSRMVRGMVRSTGAG